MIFLLDSLKYIKIIGPSVENHPITETNVKSDRTLLLDIENFSFSNTGFSLCTWIIPQKGMKEIILCLITE